MFHYYPKLLHEIPTWAVLNRVIESYRNIYVQYFPLNTISLLDVQRCFNKIKTLFDDLKLIQNWRKMAQIVNCSELFLFEMYRWAGNCDATMGWVGNNNGMASQFIHNWSSPCINVITHFIRKMYYCYHLMPDVLIYKTAMF